ncbi:MAG: glycosyltransferase family 4 protein [Lentisphaeria bacterium]|nr:glycosyltransferase family 4 protein [Lentisphaeria bacterium]
MKLFIDTSSLIHYPCGIGVYTLQLLKKLTACSDLEICSGIKCLSPLAHRNLRSLLKRNLEKEIKFRSVYLPGRLDLKENFLRHIFSIRSSDYDIAHFTGNVVPACVPYSDISNVILTIHDMFLWHPDICDNEKSLISYYQKNMPEQARRCKKIVTVSEFSKREIMKYLGIPGEKIQVIPIATQWNHPLLEQSDILARYGLEEKKYFLSVSALNAHKNFSGLCHAFSRYHAGRGYHGEKLVIVGARRFGDEEIMDQIRKTQDVIYIPNVPERELRYLYKKARGFFLVSFLEGFGIPLLEAMECRIPACYGKGNSMDEIGRDAAFGVDPHDINSIADTFHYFSENPPDLSARVEAAYNISREYSWEKTAEKHYALYQSLMG